MSLGSAGGNDFGLLSPRRDNVHAEAAITGTTAAGLEILGHEMKELIQGARNLRQLGIEELGLPLPKLIVVGDQSTGKSSLIEGISEIKVPRNAGTCTRCPLEINTTESGGEWKCQVSLFKRYAYQNLSRDAGEFSSGSMYEGATPGRPFGPWHLQESEHYPFALLTSQHQVASTLKLAQLATLNPGIAYTNFLPGRADPGNTMRVKFSPNIIRLDISGPGLPNMTLYDLPGVISVHEIAEEQYLVALVKNLVMEYVQDRRCIILLALPMTDDPMNSTAFDLIRRAKAESRTVGVLTKPDRVQSGESLEQWIQMLNGQRFKLGFGYYVTRNNPDPSVSNATARAEERHFFSLRPWTTNMCQYQNQFGTLRLQNFLSRELAMQIGKSLPHLKKQVQGKATANTIELESLPEPPAGNMPMILLEAVLHLELQIKSLIEGGELFEFKQKWHQTAARFHERLLDLRPEVRLQSQNNDAWPEETPHLTPSSQSSKRKKFVISVDSDSEERSNLISPTSSQSSKKRRMNLNGQETQKSQINPIGGAAMTTPTKSQQDRAPMTTPTKSQQDRLHRYGANNSGDHRQAARFTLPQIREILTDGHFIPNGIDPYVTQRLVKLSLKVWSLPLEEFLARTEELCREMFNEQIARSFGRWRSTALYKNVVALCDELIKEAMAEQRKHAKRVVQLERDAPTAHNHEVLGIACQNARTEVLIQRRVVLVEEWAERNAAATPSRGSGGKWPGNNLGGIKPVVVTDEQLGVDPYLTEVCLMGDIRGYYTYALTRFIDTITQSIKGEFFLRLRTGVGPLLKDKLGIMLPDASERCAVLLAIDAHTLERRQQLLREREVIAEAKDWFEKAEVGEW